MLTTKRRPNVDFAKNKNVCKKKTPRERDNVQPGYKPPKLLPSQLLPRKRYLLLFCLQH